MTSAQVDPTFWCRKVSGLYLGYGLAFDNKAETFKVENLICSIVKIDETIRCHHGVTLGLPQ